MNFTEEEALGHLWAEEVTKSQIGGRDDTFIYENFHGLTLIRPLPVWLISILEPFVTLSSSLMKLASKSGGKNRNIIRFVKKKISVVLLLQSNNYKHIESNAMDIFSYFSELSTKKGIYGNSLFALFCLHLRQKHNTFNCVAASR